MNSVDHALEPKHTFVVMVDDISPAYSLAEHEELFEIFDRYGVKPMLFIIPNHANVNALTDNPKWSELIKRKIDEGYEVGLHGYDHSNWEFFNLTRSQTEEKLDAGLFEFEQALGTRPKLFRAPNMAILPQVHTYLEEYDLKDASKTIGHEYTWYAENFGNKVSLFQNSLGQDPYVFYLHLHAANTPVGLEFLDYTFSYFRTSRQITLEAYLDEYDTSMTEYLRRHELESNT